MKKRIVILLLVVAALCAASCSDKKKVAAKQKETIITAKLQTPVKPLYLTGTIDPLKTVSVLSPVDGRIEKLNFQYGEVVKKNQLLAVINSIKLMDTFRQTVSDYLEKKATYLIQEKKMQGNTVLYKAGVIARNDYLDDQNSYQTAVISFLQQEYTLLKFLGKTNIDPQAIENLTLKDTKRIQALFSKKFNDVRVASTATGVALFPIPGQGPSGDDNEGDGGSGNGSSGSGQLFVGSNIREGQLLLSVGDLSGYSISMLVSEVSINSLRKGMSAIVTGDAFPGLTLKGVISYVASQAQPSEGGGETASLGQFKVVVKVQKLPPNVEKIIHVGMTAKVEIPIKGQQSIILPLAAVFEKNDQQMVTIIDKSGKKIDVPVETGGSTEGSVVIVSGIKPGQKVVVRD